MYLVYYRNFAGRVVSAKLEQIPCDGGGKPTLVIESCCELTAEDAFLPLSILNRIFPFPVINKEPDNGQKKEHSTPRREDNN